MPGQSRAKGRRPPRVKYSPRRRAWLFFSQGTLTWYDGPTDIEEYKTDEPGDEQEVFFQMRSGRSCVIRLTRLTEPELLELRQFFNDVFDGALDVVKARDAHAQQMLEEGDDSYARIYRRLPERHDRKRSKS